MVIAVVVESEERGTNEEDGREDEDDPGDDDHPRCGQVKPRRRHPVVPWRRRGRRSRRSCGHGRRLWRRCGRFGHTVNIAAVAKVVTASS
jgi:hypothetical protein